MFYIKHSDNMYVGHGRIHVQPKIPLSLHHLHFQEMLFICVFGFYFKFSQLSSQCSPQLIN